MIKKEHTFCTSFKRLVIPKKGETIVFAHIVFKSRAHRDRVNNKCVNDPRMNPEVFKIIPFDSKQMAYNGFETIVNL
jgi:uncharacterized protein YbaA (DUF1428 family)